MYNYNHNKTACIHTKAVYYYKLDGFWLTVNVYRPLAGNKIALKAIPTNDIFLFIIIWLWCEHRFSNVMFTVHVYVRVIIITLFS